jgi:hypothetical protein
MSSPRLTIVCVLLAGVFVVSSAFAQPPRIPPRIPVRQGGGCPCGYIIDKTSGSCVFDPSIICGNYWLPIIPRLPRFSDCGLCRVYNCGYSQRYKVLEFEPYCALEVRNASGPAPAVEIKLNVSDGSTCLSGTMEIVGSSPYGQRYSVLMERPSAPRIRSNRKIGSGGWTVMSTSPCSSPAKIGASAYIAGHDPGLCGCAVNEPY